MYQAVLQLDYQHLLNKHDFFLGYFVIFCYVALTLKHNQPGRDEQGNTSIDTLHICLHTHNFCHIKSVQFVSSLTREINQAITSTQSM